MSGARLIRLKTVSDERGRLSIAEVSDHIPFVPKRLFVLHDIASGAKRGGHAHREQQQLVCMMSGRCVAITTNGAVSENFDLQAVEIALYVPPLVWLELAQFSQNAVCAVLTSGQYDERDYIRDWSEFSRSATS